MPHSPSSRARAVRTLLAALASLALGCSSLPPCKYLCGRVDPPVPLGGDGEFRVGAARVDLTPIPGIPMSYSFDGKISRGFWTRLYARAIYLEDADRNALVFVACELAAIPNGLRDRVAELVRDVDSTKHLGRAQIVLAATHTHHGPQNFFSSKYYNSLPSQRMGFDWQLFRFLSERIRDAIVAAVKNARPGGDVAYRDGKLGHFFRNRSLFPFLLNPESQGFIAANVQVPDDCDLAVHEDEHDRRACRAVRAVVEVVDFRDADGKPIATAVFLGAHPTVMEPDTEVFTGDLFGVTSLLLEQNRLAATCGPGYVPPPVVAIFNGAEGDASVTWVEGKRNRLALDALARRLAGFVCGAHTGIEASGTQLQSDPDIRSSFVWPFDLRGRADDVSPPTECDPWRRNCTVDEPRPGLPSMGGAQDGRTIWYEAGVQPGLRAAARGRGGRKAIGSDAMGIRIELAKDLAPQNPDLELVPLGFYRIGTLAIATLPGEFTTMVGDRIRRALRQELAGKEPPTDHVLLIGLGNGRVSYVTTPEEYDAQYYEGGQNLFGAATGTLIERGIVDLAKSGASSPLDPEYAYAPGTCRVFLPSDAGLPGYFPDDGLEDILRDASGPKRDYPAACWVDAIPKLSKIPNACVRAVPYVWIEKKSSNPDAPCAPAFGDEFLKRSCDGPPPDAASDPRLRVPESGGIPQDNCGTDLVTVLDGSYRDRTHWCAFWINDSPPTDGDYRFCVAGVTGAVIEAHPAQEDVLPELPFDEGNGMVGDAVHHILECTGIATRKVCEFPSTPP